MNNKLACLQKSYAHKLKETPQGLRCLMPSHCEPPGPAQGSKYQNTQNQEKRVSGSKTPFSHDTGKGRFESENPHFLLGTTEKTGIFWLKPPISWVVGNGGFSTPNTSFPDFGDFDPCAGSGEFASLGDRRRGTQAHKYEHARELFTIASRRFLPTEWSGRAKGAARGSCGETVVQKGAFGESVSSLLRLRSALKTPERPWKP